MSRRLLCNECGNRYPESSLKKLLLPRSPEGFPAEYARIIKGLALLPKAEQRVMYYNDEPLPLEEGHYNCDGCGSTIKPGDSATCVTVWTESQPIPALWENEFIRNES